MPHLFFKVFSAMLLRLSRNCVFALFVLFPHWVVAAGEAPGEPQNLTGSVDNGAVSLQWDVSTDADDAVVGYNIYRNNAYLSTVFDNQYEGQVEPDTLYSFYVVAFDEAPRRFSQPSQSIALPQSLVPTDLTIPPSEPTDLAGEIDGTTVSIQWTASTDDEAVLGYNVYRNNQYLTTVSGTEYSGEIANGESLSFYIVAFDIRRNFSQRSSTITLPDRGPVDTTISPEAPDNLAGFVVEDDEFDTVTLSWNEAVDDQAVAGYNIYRDGLYIATRFTTAYVGQVLAGSSNAFSIVAFDFDGNFSVQSSSIILPEGPGSTDPGVPPSVPVGLAGDIETANGQTAVSLTWEPSTGIAQVAGYNIYRNNGYLTTVRTTEFNDTVVAGQAFSYAVVSFDNFGNFSARSERLSLLGEANQPPFFTGLQDQTLQVGALFELRLLPVDLDGGAAGILTSSLPAGMENVDNQDGTRSLVWTPSLADVGSYDITLTAFDLLDTDLRTAETITLTVANDTTTEQAPFSISVPQIAYNLREGDAEGLEIPVTLVRNEDFDGNVLLGVTDESGTDASLTNMSFSDENLTSGENQSTLVLKLNIDVLPISAEQRQFSITASNSERTDTISVTVGVTPVQRDDIYLLIGQSNMVGLSEGNAKQAGAGQADETNLRIRQLNVTANEQSRFVVPQDFVSDAANIASPRLVPAEDPLHVPVDPDSLGKEGTTIGLGLTFAKQALNDTTRNIVLVPAAWSSSSFCESSSVGAYWNAVVPDNPALGDNTLLFDRALARVNTAIAETGGIVRGILWLQGESDRSADCAPLYEDNMVTMIEAFRTDIDVDARGEQARGADASLPFVVGTLSRGADERADLSTLSENAMIVDNVHRSIRSLVPYSDVSLHDDLVPSNGFNCGLGSCIHFGSDALREIGVRYYDALRRASGG